VGGGVRDLLLGLHPKDFDISTNATPEQVKSLFSNCRLIGRRFRLAHVHFGREIIEVATFRAAHDQTDGEGVTVNGMILRDNVFGSLEEDAWRRDFTVNALYYNIADFSVVDYTGGLNDLREGKLCMIGDAHTRFLEDPVRMLRAARFAAKLGFSIDPEVRQKIISLGHKLDDVPAARLFEEVLKIFQSGHGVNSYKVMRDLDLFGYLFRLTDRLLKKGDTYCDKFNYLALSNTDKRIASGKPVNPAFLFAAFLWGPVRQETDHLLQAEGLTELQAIQEAGNDIVMEQIKQVTIPKRFSFPMREIWAMQARLPRRRGKRAYRILEQKRFRASYDFLLLRNEVGEDLSVLCQWWTEFQEVDAKQQTNMVRKLGGGNQRQRKKRVSEN
jgi:poly(A) polymerase